MWVYLLALLLCVPSWVDAAVTVDTTSSGEGISATTATSSHSHTIAADANLVIVCLAERDSDAGGLTADTASVTVGGASATKLNAVTNPDATSRGVFFYKLAPATGSQTIAVTADTGTNRLTTGVISLKGAAQTSTFNTSSTNSSNTGTNADLNGIASALGEFVLVCGSSVTAAASATPDATAPTSTEQLDVANSDSTSIRVWIYTEDGAASTTDIRVDLASGNRWTTVGSSIRPLSAAFGPLRGRHR